MSDWCQINTAAFSMGMGHRKKYPLTPNMACYCHISIANPGLDDINCDVVISPFSATSRGAFVFPILNVSPFSVYYYNRFLHLSDTVVMLASLGFYTERDIAFLKNKVATITKLFLNSDIPPKLRVRDLKTTFPR